jgi:hypothetical protein
MTPRQHDFHYTLVLSSLAIRRPVCHTNPVIRLSQLTRRCKFNEMRINEDLGNIASDVKVDGVPVAKLDVKQSVIPGSGSLEYKINSLTNVTRSTSKVFTLTIPPDTHEANLVPGTDKAVSDGWWVFFEAAPSGNAYHFLQCSSDSDRCPYLTRY